MTGGVSYTPGPDSSLNEMGKADAIKAHSLFLHKEGAGYIFKATVDGLGGEQQFQDFSCSRTGNVINRNAGVPLVLSSKRHFQRRRSGSDVGKLRYLPWDIC